MATEDTENTEKKEKKAIMKARKRQSAKKKHLFDISLFRGFVILFCSAFEISCSNIHKITSVIAEPLRPK